MFRSPTMKAIWGYKNLKTCACLCGQEFQPTRSNQKFVNASHRERARNGRRPRVRVSADSVALLHTFRTRQEADSAVGTVGQGTKAPAIEQEMGKAKMLERLEPLLSQHEVAKIFRIAVSTLRVWRRRSVKAGPQWIRVGGQVRYRLEAIRRYIEERVSSYDSANGSPRVWKSRR